MSSEPNNQTNTAPSAPTSVADDLRHLNNQIRAKIVSDALKKSVIGSLTGAAFSFLIFKRKLAPIWFGLGLGLGMAYSDGSQLVRTAHDSILESAYNRYDSEFENKQKTEEINDKNSSSNSNKN